MLTRKHIHLRYLLIFLCTGIFLVFFLLSKPAITRAAEAGTEIPLHVYFNFYDSSSNDIDHTIGLYSMEVNGTVIGAYLEANINPWPGLFDFQEVNGFPQVFINYGDVSGREINITAECHYDADTGFIQIPDTYCNTYLTVKCIMSEQSKAYQMLIPDEYKIIKSQTPLLQRSPATDTAEFEVLKDSCNDVIAKADFSQYKVGDQITIHNAYIQTLNKLENPSLYEQTGTTAYMGYKGERIGYAISFDCGTDSPFTNIGNSGTDGIGQFPVSGGTYTSIAYASRNWIYARCITTDSNYFDGNPKFTGGKIYITNKDANGILTCWVELYLSGPKGENAQNVGMYFKVQPKPLYSLTIIKKDANTEKQLSGAQFSLWSYDGTAYSNRLGAFTDNQDGTYTFNNIDVSSSYNQKFLIKEDVPPKGYKLPYVQTTIQDQLAYKLYGGRTIQLTDGIWSSTIQEFATFSDEPQKINLTINKTLYLQDIWWAHGEPTFLFTISGTDIEGNAHTWKRSLTFTKEYADAYTASNKTITMSITLKNIPNGSYYISEHPVSRFALTAVTAQTDNIQITQKHSKNSYNGIKPIIATVYADLSQNSGEVTFLNRKISWDKLTHKNVCINEFPLSLS